MKRRSFLFALLVAPLAPIAAKIASALPKPAPAPVVSGREIEMVTKLVSSRPPLISWSTAQDYLGMTQTHKVSGSVTYWREDMLR